MKAGLTCRPGGLTNAAPQEVGNLYVSKEDTLFAGKESPGKSVSRESVSSHLMTACYQYICVLSVRPVTNCCQ